jgi:DNA-binding HxlR family transcriptional regulator
VGSAWRDTHYMRNYGQYCPVARGAEIFAERWTPIIMRNVLHGCRTFNDIAAGAPGLSRALLTHRLRELEHAGVIGIRPKPDGHGSLYEPTAAGLALEPVLTALGMWAEEWTDVRPEHSDPAVVVWSWGRLYLRRESLPDRRVVIRFEFQRRGRRETMWLLIERHEAELCAFDPGFGDDLVVVVNDPVTFARWHLGHIEWTTALRSGGVTVTGPPNLRRAMPTWNRRPEIGANLRAAQRVTAGSRYPSAREYEQPPPSPDPRLR